MLGYLIAYTLCVPVQHQLGEQWKLWTINGERRPIVAFDIHPKMNITWFVIIMFQRIIIKPNFKLF